MVAGLLDRYGGKSFSLRDDLWAPEVQQRMAGAVVVTAVRGDLNPETVFNWSWPTNPHGIDRYSCISPRQPRLLEYPRGHALRITAAQALRGEVLALPVERVPAQVPAGC